MSAVVDPLAVCAALPKSRPKKNKDTGIKHVHFVVTTTYGPGESAEVLGAGIPTGEVPVVVSAPSACGKPAPL